MNILMLGWELPPHNSGGLGVACYHMAKQLALKGVNIDFVVPYKADHGIDFMTVHHAIDVTPDALLLPGAYESNCYNCDESGCEHTVPTSLRGQQQQYVKYVERTIQVLQPDVIHAHDWLTFEAGMRAKELTNRPLVAHVHATEFDRSGEHHGNPLVHDIEMNGLMMADRIVAVSKITKAIIVREYNIPASKVEVVHNSIDTTEYPPLTEASSYPYIAEMKKRGYKVVVSLGRLTVQKGLTYLLDAARKALEHEPKLLFLIAGAGEQRDELLELAAEYGIAKHVIFTGFIRGKAWRDAYDIGDMFVMPSVSEPFGLVALEAAGHKNALLISKQSGVVEVLNNILTYDYWETEKLADQIVAICRHDSLRSTLTKQLSNEYQNMSWQKAAHSFAEMYQRLEHEEAKA